jgi:hypothetical protein
MPGVRFMTAPLSLAVGLLVAMCSCTALSTSDSAAQVKRYWDKRLTRCGGRYFTEEDHPGDHKIMEYKGLSSATVEDLDLTDADKLNGYERRILTSVDPTACRVFYDGTVGSWSSWMDSVCRLKGTLEKRNGRWYYGGQDANGYPPTPTGRNRYSHTLPADCERMPQ